VSTDPEEQSLQTAHESMTDYFAHKVVVITGATSGIGRSVAHALVRRGARVVAAGRNEAALNALQEAPAGTSGSVLTVRTDVTDRQQVMHLVQTAVDRFGRIDVLICSAGIYLRRPVRELTLADLERLMSVNFYGVVHCLQEVLPLMITQGSGDIAVVSTIDGKKGLPPDGAYVASKFALNGLLDVLRQELRGTGVHLSTILPGRVDTPMIEKLWVPAVSAKISSDRVTKTILRSIRKRRTEAIVPYLGPKTLVVLSALSAPLGDWLVRVFGLEGREESL
jgi:NAD(P)-dependent dehydrogenase (short-subunit alcohol dehydrogenase family)